MYGSRIAFSICTILQLQLVGTAAAAGWAAADSAGRKLQLKYFVNYNLELVGKILSLKALG